MNYLKLYVNIKTYKRGERIMNLPKKGGAVAVLVFGVIFLLIRIERDKIQEMRRLMLPELSVLCFWASEFSHLAEPSPGTCLYLPKKY